MQPICSQKVTLHISPLSINQIYYADKSHGWKIEARDWARQILHQISLGDEVAAVQAIRETFDPSKHVLGVDYEFYTPSFYTKAGHVSRASQDLDNILKPLNDVLFQAKFSEPGIQNFEIDDQYITRISAFKAYADRPLINITVSIYPLPALSQKVAV